MKTPMPKRITVLLDDEVYAALLARGGSERKISHALNQLVRQALDQPAVAVQQEALERVAFLQRELDRLKSDLTQQQEH